MREHAGLRIEPVGYDHPEVVRLVAQVQDEYVTRYGGPDETPLTAAELSPPAGLFLLARAGDDAVAMGGWRVHDVSRFGPVPGVRAAEIKRMFVVPTARGRGYARRLLAEVEQSARAAGRDVLVLETGLAQPEAIALYRSAGYRDIPAFGHYCASDLSVHLGKSL